LAIDNIGKKTLCHSFWWEKPTNVSNGKKQWEKRLTSTMRFYLGMYSKEMLSSR
jgi:hypothetical protein